MEKLYTTKQEPRKSIDNALRYMRMAANNEIEKWAAVAVAIANDGSYTILDGTSTVRTLAELSAKSVRLTFERVYKKKDVRKGVLMFIPLSRLRGGLMNMRPTLSQSFTKRKDTSQQRICSTCTYRKGSRPLKVGAIPRSPTLYRLPLSERLKQTFRMLSRIIP